MRKILTIGGIVAMLLLLILGPKLVSSPKKVAITESGSKTSTPVPSTSDTSPSTTSDTSGLSTYNVQPITLPDGSITYPVYTPPVISSDTPTSTSTFVAPDPTKCAGIQAEITSADASLITQDKSLEAEVQNYINYIEENSKYIPGATPVDTSKEQVAMQADEAQINANVAQINSINAPYESQLGANDCS